MKCQNPKSLEKLLHDRFADRQVKNVPGREWFQVSPEQVNEAIEKLIIEGRLWRGKKWIHLGRPPKRRKDWSEAKKAAYQIFERVLPNIQVMSCGPSNIESLSEQSGLKPTEAKAGLQWLVKHKYLDACGEGYLIPSAKFYKKPPRRALHGINDQSSDDQ